MEEKENINTNHEERFERIELEILEINKKIDKTIGSLREELKSSLESLSREFYELKLDYEVSKNSIYRTMEKMEELPDVITSLEKTIISINVNLDANTKQTEDLHIMMDKSMAAMSTKMKESINQMETTMNNNMTQVGEKISLINKEVGAIKEKSKFDWQDWIKSMIPVLLTAGITYLILSLIR